MRESTIEKKVTEHAKSLGWVSYKWSSPNNRGVPDRLYISTTNIVAIEFKASGKRPTKLQLRQIGILINNGLPVYVIDSIEDGRELFTRITVRLPTQNGRVDYSAA